MKKFFGIYILLCLVAALFLVNSAYANEISGSCSLNASLINQDPYPAMPDSYVNVVFQVSGVQNPACNGANFELIPSYPFSLDENDSLRTLAGPTYVSNYNNEWMIPYRLRVDKDALEGNTTIEIHYGPGEQGPGYFTKDFTIPVQDSRTSFDAVIQATSGSEVSIALANTGKYAANSVIVRVPEQTDFRVSGTNGQMVGNLASGDYTVVSFNVLPKMQNAQNASKRSAGMNYQSQSDELKFDVSYTDNIGERRTVNMNLPLSMSAGNFSATTGTFAGRSSRNTFTWSNWYTLIVVLVIATASWMFYRKYKSRIMKKFSKKNIPGKTPDWVEHAKDKEKTK